MPHLTEIELLRFLVQFTVLVVTSRILADLMRRAGQAGVIGELAAGLVLGPSILGYLAPPAYRLLFPADPLADHLLEAFAWAGAIMLLLYTGLETDLAILRGMGRTAALVSISGLVFPLGCGFLLGWLLPARYLPAPDQRVIFSLFMAVAMSISAVPVIAKILIDLGLMRRELGLLILAAGIIDDSAGWLLLSIVAGLAERGVVDLRSLGTTLAAALGFVACCYFVGLRLMVKLLRWVSDRSFLEHATLSVMIAAGFAGAIVTQAIGLHAVFGAFIAGLMLGRSPRIRRRDRNDLQGLTMGILAPLFFAYSGLKADLSALASPVVPALVLAVACLAKLAGCGLGGLLGRLKWRESLSVAIGMNARGGMGIVLALLGLSLGVLTPEMYTIIVAVAIVTSVMTPPLLSWSVSGVAERPSDTERAERAKILAHMPFSKEGAKLLVLSGGGPHARLAAHMASALGNHRDASLTIFRVRGANSGASGEGDFDAQFPSLKAIAESAGARNVYQRVATAEPAADAIVQESRRGYDAIFVGASGLAPHHPLGGEVLRELLRAAPVPVVIARNFGHPGPFARVLAPTTGADFSRLGVAVAILYAHAVGARVAALYVTEGSPAPFPGLTRHRRPSEAGKETVSEMKALGAQLGVAVDARLGTGSKPERVILATAEQGKFDLLVMGALFRSAEERLYFGPKVEQILSNAHCAVAVVVQPGTAGARS